MPFFWPHDEPRPHCCLYAPRDTSCCKIAQPNSSGKINKNPLEFVDTIENFSIPENCMLFTLGVESMHLIMDHAKGIQTVREVLTQRP